MPAPLLEVCLESVADVLAAAAGGADRAELCADLVEGGITPSAGAMRLAAERGSIPVMVMIRPRGGDFLYDALEFEAMLHDVAQAKEAGVAGVVFGILTADGRVDRERSARLVEAARPLGVTFHRAFDMTHEPFEALETLVELGIDRVLTSGQEDTVPAGIELLRRLVEHAGDRITVMPGCGITADNIADVAARTGARELHFTAFGRRESAMRYRNPRPYMGAGDAPGEYELQFTDADCVRRFVQAVATTT